MSLSNRVTLAQFSKMDTAAAECLPPDQIAALLEEVSEKAKCAAALKARLDGVLNAKYAARASMERAAQKKMTGTVHIADGDCDISVNLPKAVKWDQAKLAALMTTIRDTWKRDPAEYIKVTYAVDERKFEAWPSDLRKPFEDARTLGVGKATFEITTSKAEAA